MVENSVVLYVVDCECRFGNASGPGSVRDFFESCFALLRRMRRWCTTWLGYGYMRSSDSFGVFFFFSLVVLAGESTGILLSHVWEFYG